MTITVAVDAMGGDAGCAAVIAACRQVAARQRDVRVILVGQAEVIRRHLPDGGGNGDSITTEFAPDVVAMDELPARAVRRRDTSMRRALELVGEGRAQAAVSAGNTGALMGLGMIVLKKIDGVSRPAIASFVPNRNATDSCCMLDLGANVDCTPAMLRDFALMGSALARVIKGSERPAVGLLNIGAEAFKGGKLHTETAALLRDHPHINFVGNIEGYDIYRGGAEVVVCDGFAGNVALKVSEGLASMLAGMLKQAFSESATARLCGLLASPVLRRLKRRIDHRAYNGACLVGLRGVVIKSHGNADAVAFAAAIRYAADAARQNLPDIIARTADKAQRAADAAEDAPAAAEGGAAAAEAA